MTWFRLAAFLTLLLLPPAAGGFASAQEKEPRETVLSLPEGIDRGEVLAEAARRRAEWKGFDELEYAQMSRLGIRLIRGKHVEFYTDLAESKDVDSIPVVLDEAVSQLALFFGLSPEDYRNWRVEAFLISDREPFEIFGALKRAPDFEHGYALESRVWIYDQKQAYYNRFLLLHELTHAFMNWTFGDLNPRWYSEGIADFLALHRWDGKNLTLGIYPASPDEVPGFGRIDRIKKAGRGKNRKTLDDVLDFEAGDFLDNDSYAWSWSLVTLLFHSPRFGRAIGAMPYLMTRRDANRLFTELLGKDDARLNRDWYEWIASIDYAADFSSFARDDLPPRPLTDPVELTLSPKESGWQSTGIRLEAGKTYVLRAEGRFKVYEKELARALPCEAGGISLRYFAGAPLGQAAAAVPPSGARTVNPWKGAVPLKNGAVRITPDVTGPIFFRFNIPGGAAEKSSGNLVITISRDR
ncbi:MAG: hypothetical protein J6S42_01490 [Thermoguttaceae bacterium]|nr:hypothetical protein [Thermoguttaceae bacterium]